MKKAILPVLLIISLSGNAFLFLQVMGWQKAWLAQIITTSNIEQIFKNSSADTSFETLKEITKNEFSSTFKIVSVDPSDNILVGYDPHAIEINDTKLFFKDSKYIGSKANLPDLQYWWFNNEL